MTVDDVVKKYSVTPDGVADAADKYFKSRARSRNTAQGRRTELKDLRAQLEQAKAQLAAKK